MPLNRTDDISPPESALPGLPARFAGVIVSPRDTLQRVAAAPRWGSMLALVVLVSTGCMFGFMMTEVGQMAALDAQVDRLEAFGVPVDDGTYERMEQGMRVAPYMTAGTMLVTIPLVTVIVAGILFAAFSAIGGGEATFRQVFAIVVHAGAISVLQQVFTAPLNYARESLTSPTNLAVFLPMLPEHSFAARFLGTIDLFVIWWIVVLAIGLSVLYRARTGPIAGGLLAVYGLVALVIASVMGWFGG